MTLALQQLATEDSILVFLEAKVIACLYLLVIKHIGLHRVLVSYLIDVPFLLLDCIGLGPGLSLLLLTHQRLDRILI